MFRPLLMAIFRLYMKTLLWTAVQSIYVGYLYALYNCPQKSFHIQPEDGH